MVVQFKPSFFKELNALPKNVKLEVDDCITKLSKSETLQSSGVDYKKIKGKRNENYYRIRIGKYRIGCKYIQPNILLMTLMSRGDIYKHFP